MMKTNQITGYGVDRQYDEADQFVSLRIEGEKILRILQKWKRIKKTVQGAELLRDEEDCVRIAKYIKKLQEQLKLVLTENQSLRDLGQIHQATANELRNTLAQLKDICNSPTAGLDDVVDAESRRGSSSGVGKTVRRTAATETEERKRKMCRHCLQEESCVMVLPCRHFCLCEVCASSVDICPVCKSPKIVSILPIM